MRASIERGPLWTSEVTLHHLKKHPGAEVSVTPCQVGEGEASSQTPPPSEALEV